MKPHRIKQCWVFKLYRCQPEQVLNLFTGSLFYGTANEQTESCQAWADKDVLVLLKQTAPQIPFRYRVWNSTHKSYSIKDKDIVIKPGSLVKTPIWVVVQLKILKWLEYQKYQLQMQTSTNFPWIYLYVHIICILLEYFHSFTFCWYF